jgi:hypothetical protein
VSIWHYSHLSSTLWNNFCQWEIKTPMVITTTGKRTNQLALINEDKKQELGGAPVHRVQKIKSTDLVFSYFILFFQERNQKANCHLN